MGTEGLDVVEPGFQEVLDLPVDPLRGLIYVLLAEVVDSSGSAVVSAEWYRQCVEGAEWCWQCGSQCRTMSERISAYECGFQGQPYMGHYTTCRPKLADGFRRILVNLGKRRRLPPHTK
jgi:hypothetical protein